MVTNNRLKSKTFLWICSIVLLVGAMLAGTARPGLAEDPSEVFDAKQSQAIEGLVRQYLLDHPEVLVEALHAYDQRQKAAQAERQRQAVVAEAKALQHDPDAPVLGNPDGDVTLVEFFDYRCPYCKRMTGPLQQLVNEDPNLRVVMKEFPILSQESVVAARAALAAVRQNKYAAFHMALMENGGGLSDDEIMAVADSVGLDESRLRSDMKDPAIEAALRRNHALAEKIGVTGTPAFVVGDTLIPGAVGMDQLRQMIAKARAKGT